MSLLLITALMSSGAAEFDPSDLFSGPEDGGWYDPSDLSTLWQDTAGTTAVTTDGQSVARIDDKSGNGRHLTQSTASSRPLYKTSGGLHWLEFDGTNDYLQSASSDASITDGGGTLAASSSSDNAEALYGILEEVDVISEAVDSSFRNIVYFDTRSTPKRLCNYASDDTDRYVNLDSEIDGTEKVFIFSSDGSTGEGYLDGVQNGSSVTTTANFANNTKLTLGKQTAASLHLNGKIYGALILDRGLTGTERGNLNTWLSSKAGI